jgi:glycosyltransferase involved in cell wall biosynthesis
MVILMNKITYIFSKGRIKKITDNDYAEDFFYGYRYLSEKNLNVEIIEFKKINKLFKAIEHKISKIFSLPLYVFSLINQKNFKILKTSDYLFLVSESVGFAALPLLMLLKKRYNIHSSMFVMGLFSKKINYKYFKSLHFFLIKFLASYFDKLYFLGYKEYEIAQKHLKSETKLLHLPFYIDTNFWKDDEYRLQSNEKILFIGNDGNRDFDLLVEIAKRMKHRNFIFVSSNSRLTSLEMENVEIIKGNWSGEYLSDKTIREIYSLSRMVILPLKDSTQPSGQSVTLQAMSMGVPVIISLTTGFWDKDKFIDELNIFFEQENNLNSWVNKIDSLFNDVNKLKYVSKNSVELIAKNFDIGLFNDFMLNEVKYGSENNK